MKITSSTGVFVAPVGADPTDADGWSEIGHLMEGQLTTVGAAPEYDHGKVLDTLKEFSAEFKVSRPDPDVFASLFGGIPVYEAPSLRFDMLFDATRYAIYAPSVEPRPYTDLEREGEWARRTVRRGLTDAFPWLNEDPGPDPDAAYTDELWKVSLLAGLGVNPA